MSIRLAPHARQRNRWWQQMFLPFWRYVRYCKPLNAELLLLPEKVFVPWSTIVDGTFRVLQSMATTENSLSGFAIKSSDTPASELGSRQIFRP